MRLPWVEGGKVGKWDGWKVGKIGGLNMEYWTGAYPLRKPSKAVQRLWVWECVGMCVCGFVRV